MRIALRVIPSFLCGLLMGAHLMRGGHTLLMGPAMVVPLIVLVRASWARRAMQALLVIGALMWVAAAVDIVDARQAAEREWVRAAVILGGVAAFYVLAALLLQGRRMRAYYVPEDEPAPAPEAGES